MATGLCVRWPFCVMLIMLIPLLLAGISVTEPFEIDTEGGGLSVRNHIVSEQLDAARVMMGQTYFDVKQQSLADSDAVDEQTQPRFALTVIFEAPNDGNVFRADRLASIQTLHRRIEASKRYNEFCLKTKNLLGEYQCAPPASLMNWFFPSEPPAGFVPPPNMMPSGTNTSAMMSPDGTIAMVATPTQTVCKVGIV